MSRGQATEAARMEAKRRVAYIAPLFAYLRAHHFSVFQVMCAASEASGQEISSVRITRMRIGEAIIPVWLVERCCVVIGKPVSEVMGAEWVKRFGADGRGGDERAPVGEPRWNARNTLSNRRVGSGGRAA